MFYNKEGLYFVSYTTVYWLVLNQELKTYNII